MTDSDKLKHYSGAIPALEQAELEAWRTYQQHAKETERLLKEWRFTYTMWRAGIERERQEQAKLCTTESP